MKTKILATLLGAALFGLSMTAGAAEMLADRHGARNTPCAACHQTATPQPGAKVSSASCTNCHGSLDKVAERTKALDPNPHYNHLIGTDCQECHKGHTQSVNLCASCHNLTFKVP